MNSFTLFYKVINNLKKNVLIVSILIYGLRCKWNLKIFEYAGLKYFFSITPSFKPITVRYVFAFINYYIYDTGTLMHTINSMINIQDHRIS